jgi:predicted nucleic acid-binding protein
MSDRFFLDTNIFVYSFDSTARGKQTKAEQLIRKALSSQKGVVSYQVVQEFFNVALKRFAKPMKRSDADEYLATVFRPMLSIHSSLSLYRQAMHVHFESRTSWYDSLIIGSALQAECRILFSEDMQHGRKIGSLDIINPFL